MWWMSREADVDFGGVEVHGNVEVVDPVVMLFPGDRLISPVTCPG
jgi:hypothetical protein